MTMQPVQLAINIDARLVGMQQGRCDQLVNQLLFKLLQQGKYLLIEVVDRTDANGKTQLILKIFLYPLIAVSVDIATDILRAL